MRDIGSTPWRDAICPSHVRKKPDTDALFERLRTLRGRLSPDFKFNRDQALRRALGCAWSYTLARC